MMLNVFTDLALRLLMHFGQHPDRLCTIAVVAQAPARLGAREPVCLRTST